MGAISKPELVTPSHDIVDFNSGSATLDDWLKKRTLKNQDNGASRTFVICESNTVIGFYSLATGSVERATLSSNFSRNMPQPNPIIILGRLAIDLTYQGQGLGALLLKDALLRTFSISNDVGIRGILVHAISEQTKRFYLNYGFIESSMEPMTLLLSIRRIKTHFQN